MSESILTAQQARDLAAGITADALMTRAEKVIRAAAARGAHEAYLFHSDVNNIADWAGADDNSVIGAVAKRLRAAGYVVRKSMPTLADNSTTACIRINWTPAINTNEWFV